MLGADVDSDIPDRMKDGCGLNRNLIDRALEADVIRSLPVITDCGGRGDRLCKSMGMRLW